MRSLKELINYFYSDGSIHIQYDYSSYQKNSYICGHLYLTYIISTYETAFHLIRRFSKITTFIYTGKSSNLSTYNNPPLNLEEDSEYEIAFVNFDSFYSTPNIDNSNNTFKWWSADVFEHISNIPEGAYDITNISDTIQTKLSKIDKNAILA